MKVSAIMASPNTAILFAYPLAMEANSSMMGA